MNGKTEVRDKFSPEGATLVQLVSFGVTGRDDGCSHDVKASASKFNRQCLLIYRL